MNRHYLNLEQDVEQPRWSWDHIALWGLDLLTCGELNLQSFANLEPRTPTPPPIHPWVPVGYPWSTRGVPVGYPWSMREGLNRGK